MLEAVSRTGEVPERTRSRNRSDGSTPKNRLCFGWLKRRTKESKLTGNSFPTLPLAFWLSQKTDGPKQNGSPHSKKPGVQMPGPLKPRTSIRAADSWVSFAGAGTPNRKLLLQALPFGIAQKTSPLCPVRVQASLLAPHQHHLCSTWICFLGCPIRIPRK